MAAGRANGAAECGTAGIGASDRRYSVRTAMAFPADFRDAHLRHWQDAELLYGLLWCLLGRRGGVRPIRER